MNATDTHALIAAARDAARHAHAPYSRFAVGAALLMQDGSVITGANFENASYGLSLCAETVAIATASAAGRLREIVAVGVIGGAMDPNGVPTGTSPVSPCGRCRQVINEAAQMGGRDLPVHCGAAEGDAVRTYRLSELSAGRLEIFMVGMDRACGHRRLFLAQLRKGRRQVRLCSVLSANQASMSSWPQDERVLSRVPSHCRKVVACLNSPSATH